MALVSRRSPVAAAVVAVALAGCTGEMTAADFAKMRDDALCASYGGDDRERELVRAEIDRRGLVPAYDWTKVTHGDIGFGMHRCSVLAAWHEPATKVGGGAADIEIWTYSDERVVRFENGTVRSVTDFR